MAIYSEKINSLIGRNKPEQNFIRKIRVNIPAQAASVSPPLGPLLGQFGVNIVDFCKQFNERSKIFDQEVMLSTVIYLYKNKVFAFDIKGPSLSFLINEVFINLTFEKDLPLSMPLSSFYKIVRFRSLFDSDKGHPDIAKNLVSVLQSMGITVYDDISRGSGN